MNRLTGILLVGFIIVIGLSFTWGWDYHDRFYNSKDKIRVLEAENASLKNAICQLVKQRRSYSQN